MLVIAAVNVYVIAEGFACATEAGVMRVALKSIVRAAAVRMNTWVAGRGVRVACVAVPQRIGG